MFRAGSEARGGPAAVAGRPRDTAVGHNETGLREGDALQDILQCYDERELGFYRLRRRNSFLHNKKNYNQLKSDFGSRYAVQYH